MVRDEYPSIMVQLVLQRPGQLPVEPEVAPVTVYRLIVDVHPGISQDGRGKRGRQDQTMFVPHTHLRFGRAMHNLWIDQNHSFIIIIIILVVSPPCIG